MSPIFAMISVATFRGSRARTASNSAEKICVAAPGIRLRAHCARASGAEVRFAAMDRGCKLRRHFQLILKPLLQPFPQLLGVFHREPRDCCFDLCNRAHGENSRFCEVGLQGRSVSAPTVKDSLKVRPAFLVSRIFGVRVFGKSVESIRFLELPFPAFPSSPSLRSQAQVPFSKPMPEEKLTKGTVPGFSRGPRAPRLVSIYIFRPKCHGDV